MSAQSQIQKAFARVENKIEQQYRNLLKKHDWFSEYSDDHSVWEKASVEYTRIMFMAEKIDCDYKIFNEYAPDEYKKESKNG
jgi:hypothetical protein